MPKYTSRYSDANRFADYHAQDSKLSIRLDADFTHGIDRLLKSVCEKVQLSRSQHQLADEHYKAVGNWLEGESSNLIIYKPRLYPQGSLPMGVTNKPLDSEEYDLDFICELNIQSSQISPTDLFSKIEYRIRQHADYKDRIELGKRCIRLSYAQNFHLDIVPACTNSSAGYGQVRIPDRELEDWRDTNSKQYVEWFNTIADLPNDTERIDAAEPLVPQEAFDDKSALKFAVQLLKRHRDIAFTDQPDLAPVSIVLSTLAAETYSGNTSVFSTVKKTLNIVHARIEQSQERLEVWNPANAIQEDLGERWDKNPDAYDAFKSWISQFKSIWEQLEYSRGYEQINDLLASLFGEHPTREAIREEAQRLDAAKQSGQLGVVSGTGLLTTQAPEILVPRNTFYGQ